MAQHLLDWFVVALRWAHIVAILGWVGSALYFNWLESKLRKPGPPRPGVLGEAWMGHGGGFYIVEKRQLAPGEVPSPVYWFRVEAGITWVTGFLLLVFVYYWSGGVDLVDPDSPLGPKAAIAFAIGAIAVCWVIYDRLWLSQLAQDRVGLVTVISLVLLFAAVLVLCKLFSGRAAFIHVGSILGTNMVFSVWTRIIPSQEEAVAAARAGRERNMAMGLRARRRALHNTYMTLPVIFTMIAVHAPAAHSHPLNWLILTLLIAGGIGARHMMLLFDRATPVGAPWAAAVAPVAAAVLVLGFLSLPRGEAPAPSQAPVPFSVVRGIVDLRCLSCHARVPSDRTFAGPAGGLSFDTDEQIAGRAALLKTSTATTRSMPPGNSTRITDEERALLARWVDEGARTGKAP